MHDRHVLLRRLAKRSVNMGLRHEILDPVNKRNAIKRSALPLAVRQA